MVNRTQKVVFLLACAFPCFAAVPAHAAPASQAGTKLQLAFWNTRRGVVELTAP